MYTPKQIMLAEELAETLHDWHSITQYLKFTALYTEEQLRDVLNRVMAMPHEKIKRSRGALFTYLLQQYDTYKQYSGHKSGNENNRDGSDHQW